MRLACAALALIVIGAVGCDDGDSSADAAAGGGDAGPVRFTLRGRIFEYALGIMRAADLDPVEGAQVCKLDTKICTETDADGFYELELEVDPTGSIIASKDGYHSTIYAGITGQDDADVGLPPGVGVLLSESLTEAFAALLDTPYPPENKGVFVTGFSVEVQSLDSGVRYYEGFEGISARVVEGEAAGPAYGDDTGLPDKTLDGTTQFSGWVTFYEAKPGNLTLAFKGQGGKTCAIRAGFPGDGPDTIRAPVRANTLTQTYLVCD